MKFFTYFAENKLDMMIRKCSLTGKRAEQLLEKTGVSQSLARQAMAQRISETYERDGFPHSIVTPTSRSCYPRDVYFHPEKVIALTDPLYWRSIPDEDLKNNYVYTIAYPSHSERSLVIIWDERFVSEFKGETLPPEHLKSAPIHDQSQEPYGFLLADKGRREEKVLNFVGAIKARFHLLGQGTNENGKSLEYGQLVREANDFMPWMRLDRSFNEIIMLTEWLGIPCEEFLTSTAQRIGTQLKKLHPAPYFNLGFRKLNGLFEGIAAFHHLGNIEIHGNILDLGGVRTLDETKELFDKHDKEKKSDEEIMLYSAFLEIYRIFGGVYPPTQSFVIGLDSGLLSREWHPDDFNFFLWTFARSYLGENTKDLENFTENWHDPKKAMSILARNRQK